MHKIKVTFKPVITFVLLLLCCLNCYADDICKTDKFGNNVCDIAREIADALSRNLPSKMNQNLTLQQVIAIKNMVKSTLVLSYDSSYLETFLEQNGGTLENIKSQMKKTTVARLCREGSQSKTFFKLGGQIQHEYLYSDMLPFMVINIKTCDSNWYDSSLWVKDLTEEEQVAVIALMRNELLNHLEVLGQSESNHGSEGQMWMVLINGIAHQLMATLATKSPKMQLVLEDEARLFFDFAKGKIKHSAYVKSDNKITLRRMEILENLPPADVEKAASDFEDKAKQLGETLIVYSKLSATGEMENVK